MRSATLACLALSLVGLFPGVGAAQAPTKPTVERVEVGFPTGPDTVAFKSGTWAPVAIALTAGSAGIAQGEVVVETADSDDVQTRYAVPVAGVGPTEGFFVLTYTKPGSAASDLRVTLKADGKRYVHEGTYQALDPGAVLYLSVGGRIQGAGRGLASQLNRPGRAPEGAADVGPYHVAYVDDIQRLPTRWFGYGSVDLVLLATGNRDFLTALLNERDHRKEALAEWVRRGGRLVVSVGRNQDMIAELDRSLGLLPMEVKGMVRLPAQVPAVENWVGLQASKALNPLNKKQNEPSDPRAPMEIARLVAKGDQEVRVLVREKDSPVIVQAAYGLGNVVLVAFDLDQAPFGDWESQPEFWVKFVRETQQVVPGRGAESPAQPFATSTASNLDLATRLQHGTEDFDEVPVIPFGWVALFILLYIVVVGPLDYFLLKKVFKRLELTWITFPTMVLVISAVVYFSAYALKGNDQRINKIDLVDFDLHTRQAYGHTWFTIFSPRIQNYTVGVEAAASWAPADGRPPRGAGVVVSWMGRPEVGPGGTARPRSQGLFRRAYDYEPDAAGLRGVPLQVWSTKSFTASWEAPFGADQPPFSAQLRHPAGNPEMLSGTLTSHLPVELEDVALVYRGKWYSLDRLLPEIDKRVDGLKAAGSEWWLPSPSALPNVAQSRAGTYRQPPPTVPADETHRLVKMLLFHGEADRKEQLRNQVLRHLDQTWRLRHHKEEVLVVGRVAEIRGPAEDAARNEGSATRLWLGQLPGSGNPRPPLSGTLRQKTYVRVFIPIAR